MDALDLLRNDHDRIKSLFRQIQAVSSPKDKRSIFQQIDTLLSTHSHMEQTVFYPTFRKYDDFKEIVEKSFEDHRQADSLLEQLKTMGIDSSDFSDRLGELIRSVENHIQEEEGRFFSMVRKTMKRPEREMLGRHMQASKQEKSAA